MALDAGSVFAVLGGKFNPAGFAQFDATMKKSSATAASSEAAMSGSFKRSGAAAAAMAATVAQSAAKVEGLMIAQQRAALKVEASQVAAAAATSKYGAESLKARQATVALTASQQRLGVVNAELATAQNAHAAAQARMTQASGRSAGAMTALGSAAKTGAAVGIVALGYAMVKSVESAAKFDSAMRNVNSIARLSETQYKNLSKSVLELSGKTAQAPITLAKGMYDLVSSGFNAKESLLILESSAKAASAGLTSAEVATGAVAAVLNAYKRPATDAAQVSDDLFQTVNLGVLSFDALASSIGDVLPFAQAVGVPLKQVGAAVATLTKAGISAPEAMTRIKGALSALISPSTAMKEAFNKLGVASGEELISKTGSLQGALQALTGTVGNNKGAVAKLFPDIRGLSAALLTTGENAKSANVDLAAFGDTTGATDRVLEEQKKGVDYQVKLIKSQLSQLGVEIGGFLLPGLTQLLSNTTATLSAMRGDFTGFGLGVLGTVRAIVSGIGTAASVMRLIPGPIGEAWAKVGDAAKGTVGDIDRATATIRARELKLKLGADPAGVIKAIKDIQNSKIAPKVAKILGEKKDAESKIKALIALGIPPKIAKVLAETGSAEAALARVRRDLANISSKTVTVTVNKVGDAVGNLFSGKASGARAGTAQTAIVGEGGGPEWIVDRATGQARKVTGPQMANLNENEYVIPTESRYRPQALGLLSMLAADLGVAGFAPGRAAKKKAAAKKRAYAKQDTGIQSASDNATLYQTRMNTAETKGDSAAWTTNQKAVAGALALELSRIKAALRSKFKPQGARLTTLKQNQADVEGLIASNNAAKFPSAAAADETTYNADEQRNLDDLGRQLALAELTPEITDDQGVLAAKEKYLAGILSGAGMGAGRGGVTAVTQIATDLKSTRDQIAGLTGSSPSGPAGITPDQQAQMDQAARNQTMAAQSAAIDRLVGATLGGSPTLVFQSYVPPSPTEARRLADYTVGGIGYQGATQSSKDTVGI